MTGVPPDREPRLQAAIRRILVPLDGSDAAEGILPLVERLARALHAEVILARVVRYPMIAMEPTGGYVSPDLYAAVLESEEQTAAEYLDEIAYGFTAAGVHTRTVVRTGSPREDLPALERVLDADLVALHTSGRGGPVRLLFGSIADVLIGRGRAPLLLTRHLALLPARPGPVLVPLDGSATSEAGLELAATTAGALDTGLLLLRVVEPGNAAIGAGTEGQADLASEDARAYLNGIADVHSDLVVSAEVRAGTPASIIIATAAAEHASLIVMGTHGRTGLARARLGSVADQVVRHALEPVLLVRQAAPR